MNDILVFDPGESTGWVYAINKKLVMGGTLKRCHNEIAQTIINFKPDVVVLEKFHLFPGAAKSFAWDTFYPCEVIGVIRYICDIHKIPLVEQNPSVKRYAGNFASDWEQLASRCNTTEHTKDAYLHFKYFIKNNLPKMQAGSTTGRTPKNSTTGGAFNV